jgi:transposase
MGDGTRLTSVKRVAAMVKRPLPNVLTYFKHRITNAGSEAINTVVQMLKKPPYGYGNFRHFYVLPPT